MIFFTPYWISGTKEYITQTLYEASKRAGTYKPHLYPPLPHAHSHTQTIIIAVSEMHVFTLIDCIITDQRPSDGPTFKEFSYKVACPQLYKGEVG